MKDYVLKCFSFDGETQCKFEQGVIPSFRILADETATKNANEFLKNIDFLVQKRLEGKLIQLKSLDDEILHDIRNGICNNTDVTYSILSQIYDVPTKYISELFCKRYISGNGNDAMQKSFFKYGIRLIDMNKFFNHLIIE